MASTYTLISSNVLASNTASVTFSSIPNTYKDLAIKYSLRSSLTGSGFDDFIGLTLNGLSTTVYSRTALLGDGATAQTNNTSGTNYISLGIVDGASNTANTFTSGDLYIPSYLASQNKPLSSFKADEQNATTAYVVVHAGLFRSTSAISSLTISSQNGGTFVTNSSFYLYGI
jgi:hypothetical protein